MRFKHWIIAFAAWPVVVAAQEPVAIRIETTPGGGAPFTGAMLAAGDSVRVFAAAYDSAGAYVGPIDVAWVATPPRVQLSAANGTTIRLEARIAGTTRLEAQLLGTDLVATSGDIAILPGAPARLALHAVPPTATAPTLAAITLSADSLAVLYAAGSDAFGNFTGPHVASWSLDAPLATATPQLAQFSVLEARIAGTTTLRLAAAGLVPVAVPFAVQPGRLAALRIASTPAGAALGDTMLVIGQPLALFARGFDADGNAVAVPATASWIATAPALALEGTLANARTARGALPGTARVRLQSGAVQTQTGVVHVGAGPLSRVRISRLPDVLAPVVASTYDADQNLTLFALGQDAAGNLLGPVAANWSSTTVPVAQTQPATASATATIALGRVGSARIAASVAGALPDTSAVLTVVPGRVAGLHIETRADGSGIALGPRTVSADSSLTAHAVGRDADGNFIAAQSAAWSLTSPLGTLTPQSGPTVTVQMDRTGTTYLTAVVDVHIDLAGPFTIAPGTPFAIDLETTAGQPLAARTLGPGETATVTAVARDRDQNRIGTLPVQWTWIGDDLAPVPGAATSSYEFITGRIGAATLHAASSGLQPATSPAWTVRAGSPAWIEIHDAQSRLIGDRDLSADSTLVVHAQAFDASGNALGDVPVAWQVQTDGGQADVTPASGSSSVLWPRRVGAVRLVCTHASGITSETGAIVIRPGRAVRVQVETAAAGTGTIAGAQDFLAGEKLLLHAVGRDALGHAVGPVAATWSVEGGIGRCETAVGTSSIFAAERTGVGRVRAQLALLDAGTSGDYTVVAASPASLTLETSPGDPLDLQPAQILSADDSLLVHAVARDAFGNIAVTGPVAFAVVGPAGAASVGVHGTIATLRPHRPATVALRATWGALVAQGSPITIVAGRAARVTIETAGDGSGIAIGDRTLAAGETSTLYGVARDRQTNFVAPAVGLWTRFGTGGLLDTMWGDAATFRALFPGASQVSVFVPGLGTAATGTFTVTTGTSIALHIEQQAHEPFDPFEVSTLTAGDSTSAFAMARDALGNAIGPVIANWSLVGDAGAAILSHAEGTETRLSARRLGTVRLVARWNGREASSGPITVHAGAAAVIASTSVTVDTLRADGVSRTRITISGVADAWGNVVVDGTSVRLQAPRGTFLEDDDPRTAAADRNTIAGAVQGTWVAPAIAGPVSIEVEAGTAHGSIPLAVLPPVALAPLPATFTPAVLLGGAPLDASLAVQSDDPQRLRLTAGALRITDGNGTRVDVPLASPPPIVAAGATVVLQFGPTALGLAPGRYAPRLLLSGLDAEGHAFTLEREIGASALELLSGATLALTERSPAHATLGMPVAFTVTVANRGDADVTLDRMRTRLRSGDLSIALAASAPSVLPRGLDTTLQFATTTWPAPTPPGPAALVLDLQGSQPGGAVSVVLAAPPVAIEAPAALEVIAGSLLPVRAPQASTVALRLAVRNRGGTALDLDTRTLLRAAWGDAALVSPRRIDVDSTIVLDFAPRPLAVAQPGAYGVALQARGLQNGHPFASDTLVPDSLTAYAPTAVSIAAVRTSRPTVTRGQTQPWSIGVVVRNDGAAAARLDATQVRIIQGGLDRTNDWSLEPAGPIARVLAPATVDTLDFTVTRTGDALGLVTLEASLHGIDLVSGEAIEADTFAGGKGSVRVQAPGALRVTLEPAIGTPAIAGQSALVRIPMQIDNSGEATLDVDVASIAAAVTIAPALPFVVHVLEGDGELDASDRMRLAIDIGPFANVAPGAIELTATPQGIERNRAELVLSQPATAQFEVAVPADVAVQAVEAPTVILAGATQSWTARVAVVNRGGTLARLRSPQLTFTATGAVPAFTVTAPSSFEGESDLDLAPGATATLAFLVTTTDLVPRMVRIGCTASGEEDRSQRSFELAGGASADVLVEARPAVEPIVSTLAPLRASGGQMVAPTFVLRHTGGAPLVLDPTRSWARLAGGTVTHPLQTTATLTALATARLDFGARALDATPGEAALQVHLEGTIHGETWQAEFTTADRMHIDPPSRLEILFVRASTARVTRGQARSWWVAATVVNRGGDATLESTALVLRRGGIDASPGFAIHAPPAFTSGRAVLAEGETAALLFEVAVTADVPGEVELAATVRVRDHNSGDAFTVDAPPAALGTIRVADLARPVFGEVTLSQPRVSAGQSAPWRVHAVVRNEGETPWTPDWSGVRLAIGTIADDSIRVTSPPATALASGGSAAVEFDILRTGIESGPLALHLTLAGTQETDGRTIATAAAPALTVIAERPAIARLAAFRTDTVQPGFANVGQVVPVRFTVHNDGDAALTRASVRLHAAGAVPADTVLAVAIAGQDAVDFEVPFTAPVAAGAWTITARGEDAIDANDAAARDAWDARREESTTLVVEAPGVLDLAVSPTQVRLSAGQTQEWQVRVQIANRGDETLELRPPANTDLEFRRSDVAQLDYIVTAPPALQEGGLALVGGAAGTFVYRVLRTGQGGGDLVLVARASARHANAPDAEPATATATAGLRVDGEPGLRIVSTESLTWRRERGHDDFRVAAGHEFRLRVLVENTGGTALDSVVVDVESQRGNSAIDGPRVRDTLLPGERGEFWLPCLAGTWASQPGLPETFIARIVAARDHNTGISVLPQAPLDNTTFAYVERPASLAVQSWIESPTGAQDGSLSRGQTCVLAARVDNAGDAAVQANGRLAIELPPGLGLANGSAETFFTPGTVVRWTLQAQEIVASDSVAVRIAAVPADADHGGPAHVTRARHALAIEVVSPSPLAVAVAAAPQRHGHVSAGQTLEVEAQVGSGDDIIDRAARLTLPPAWSFAPGTMPEQALIGSLGAARWTVRTGSTLGAVALDIQVEGRDRNDGSERRASQSLALTVERPALLALSAEIIAPDEARAGRVLAGQPFIVRARVHNHGDAATEGDAVTVRLLAPAGFTVQDAELECVASGDAAEAEFVVTATAPVSGAIVLEFGRLPRDANSAAPAAVDPDAARASVAVTTADDALVVAVLPLARSLVAAGERAIPLARVTLTNASPHAVRIEAIAFESRLDGVAAISAFDRLMLSGGDTTHERAANTTPEVWFEFGAAGPVIAPGADFEWTVQGDITLAAATRSAGIALAHQGATPQVRVVQAGSGARLPVRATTPLEASPVRVLDAALVAHNAPNPFRVGRETTTIRYQVETPSEVAVRVFTLQGELVWELRRYDEATGPTLQAAIWDGRNGAGQPVRNGVYVCQVDAGSRSTRFKIAVVR